jgi:hypothetical protein
MGANSTQAVGVTTFLGGFTVLCAGLANGNILLDVLGLALVAASFGIFRKVKPSENAE